MDLPVKYILPASAGINRNLDVSLSGIIISLVIILNHIFPAPAGFNLTLGQKLDVFPVTRGCATNKFAFPA